MLRDLLKVTEQPSGRVRIWTHLLFSYLPPPTHSQAVWVPFPPFLSNQFIVSTSTVAVLASSFISCFQVHLSCPTVQSGWSFYNTNLTMSLFFLQHYCPHDEIQIPLHSKQIVPWVFSQNLGVMLLYSSTRLSSLARDWNGLVNISGDPIMPMQRSSSLHRPYPPLWGFFPLWFLDTTSCFPLPYGLLLLANPGSCSWISSFLYLHISPPHDSIQHHGFKSQLVAQW